MLESQLLRQHLEKCRNLLEPQCYCGWQHCVKPGKVWGEEWEGAGDFVSRVRKQESWMGVLKWLFPFFIGGSVHEMASFTLKMDLLSQLNLSGNALRGKCKGMFPW